MQSDSSSRIKWIDVLKGIGIILMVIGHSDIETFFKIWIYGFHMPLFFIIAGYMYSINEKKWSRLSFQDRIKKNAKAYLIPYCFLFFINLSVWTLFEIVKYREGYSLYSILKYIGAGIYSHDTLMPNCAPLWFLTCLFITYILFWIMIKVQKQCLQVLLCIIYLTLLYIINVIERYYSITQLPWHIDAALIASVFMIVGYYIHKYSDKLFTFTDKWITNTVLFIIGSIVIILNGRINMVQNQYQNIIIFFVGALAMFFVLMRLSKLIADNCDWLSRLLAFWGQNTLIFLGLNYIVNVIVQQLRITNKLLYCIVDITIVIGVCTIFATFWRIIKQRINVCTKVKK